MIAREAAIAAAAWRAVRAQMRIDYPSAELPSFEQLTIQDVRKWRVDIAAISMLRSAPRSYVPSIIWHALHQQHELAL